MSSSKFLRPSPALIVAVTALVVAMSGAAIALPGRGSVDSGDLAKGSVKQKAIAKGAVGSKQIIGKSIKGNRLKDGAIRFKQLDDAAVTEAKIADGVISTAKLAAASVTTDKLADGAVVNQKIAAQTINTGKLANGAVTGQKVEDGSLSSTDLSDYAVIGSDAGSFVKLTATDGGSEAAARTAATETTLYAKGNLTISAKCFRDTVADQTFAEMYVATSADGAIFDGSTDELSGGNAATDFLNTNTLETDRVLDDVSATAADAEMDEGEFNAVGPDGTHLIGQTTVAAKNGALAGGNGVYGDGNVCLFGGEISG